MKFNAKNMLKSREILRLVVFFAVTVLLGFSTVGNVEALIVFVVSGLLGSFYSKNMIVVLGVAILLTLIWYLFSLGYYREGLENGTKANGMAKANAKANANAKAKANIAKMHSHKKKKKRGMPVNKGGGGGVGGGSGDQNNNVKKTDGFNNKLGKVEGMITKFEGLLNKVEAMKNSMS